MHTITIALGPSVASKARRLSRAVSTGLTSLRGHCLRVLQAHTTARALKELDDRVLRDLGRSRSELRAAGVERHGLAERERWPSLFRTPLPR